MIAFGGYFFDEHKATLTCRHISDGAPILALCHDADGDLHLTCGGDNHAEGDWQVVGLKHLAERLGALAAVPPVPPGTIVSRPSEHDRWQVEP